MSADDAVELDLHDTGSVGQARLAAQDLARRLGARGDAVDRLVLVVSELATSVVVHGGGALRLQPTTGRTVIVTASAGAEADIGSSGHPGHAGHAGHAGSQGRRVGLGENLAMVRRFAASVAIEPGQRISAVVGLS